MADTPVKSEPSITRVTPSRRDEELHDRLGLPHAGRPQKSNLRTRFLDALKTLLWVIPLTGLIWIYAEREQAVAGRADGVAIRIVSSVRDRLIETDPLSPVVNLQLKKGPQASIKAVQEKLARPGTVIDVVLPESFQPGFDGEISIADWIGRNELFANEGVLVEESRPPTVRVKIEKRISLPVPLMVKAEDKAKIGGDIALSVKTVNVEGTESQFLDLPKEKQVAYVDMSKLMAYTGGTHTEEVPVTFAAIPTLPVQPRTVRVTATLAAPATKSLPPIPVWVQINALRLAEDSYTIDVERFVAGVQVTGSQKAIDDFMKDWENRQFTPLATVPITDDDLKSTESFEKPVPPESFWLPPGLTVTNAVKVKVTITKKN